MSRRRRTVQMVVLLLSLGCGEGNLGADTSALATAWQPIDYELTSENYRKWSIANDMFDSAGVSPTVRLDARTPDDDEIDAAVEALERDAFASAILDTVDLEPDDYVLTTIALAQSWAALEDPGSFDQTASHNVEFLRAQSGTVAPVRSRPRSRFFDHDDDDRGRDREIRKKNRGKGRGKDGAEGRGRDGDRGRGKGRGHD